MGDISETGTLLSQQTLHRLFQIAVALSAEQNIDTLLENIVQAGMDLCRADGGTLYLIDEDTKQLKFSIMQNNSLGIKMGGTSDREINFPPLYLYDPETNAPNYKNVATHCVLAAEIINVKDAYATDKFDFSGTQKFDESSGYHSQSFLTLPLKTRSGETIAVLQLINAQSPETNEVTYFTKEDEIILEALGSYAAVAIDNQLMVNAQRNLLESFLAVLAQTIDEKSVYLGGHCQQVPAIARMLAMAADSDDGAFKDFSMSEDDWYAFHLACWLHDCGRITIPTYLQEKTSKLQTVYNRIHEIRQRFEILRRDAHIEYLKKRLAGKNPPEALLNEFSLKTKELNEDFAFLAECNLGDKPMTDADEARLEKIARLTYHRYFDKTAGLSPMEMKNFENNPPPPENPREPVLQDAPEMISAEYNNGEIHALSAKEGVLTAEEQKRLDAHVVTTVKMLEAISFPKKLKNIVEYAGCHHEKVDGTGFPNGLTRDEMSVPARILAIADYYELLSATNRPHQKFRKLREIIAIMSEQARGGALDPDLFNLFLTSGVYKEYADQYLDAAQLEDVPVNEFLVK